MAAGRARARGGRPWVGRRWVMVLSSLGPAGCWARLLVQRLGALIYSQVVSRTPGARCGGGGGRPRQPCMQWGSAGVADGRSGGRPHVSRRSGCQQEAAGPRRPALDGADRSAVADPGRPTRWASSLCRFAIPAVITDVSADLTSTEGWRRGPRRKQARLAPAQIRSRADTALVAL